MVKIILLDGYFVQAYSVAKSLRISGYHVTLLTPTVLSYGFFSRYPHRKILSPKSSDLSFHVFFLNLLEKEHFDIALPLCNEGAEYLSLHYDDFLKYRLHLAVMPWEIFQKAHNKGILMDICCENNIPHPKTLRLTDSNIMEAATYVGFPALIKPNYSVGARGITLVRNIEELQAKYKMVLYEFGESTLQEFIKSSGSYFNVMLYRDRSGNILSHTIIEIKRFFPLKGGSSCFCVSIENEKLLDICSKTLRVLNWHGFADFDIIQDKDTEEYKILEINPRIPASVEAAFVSGVNFPELIATDLLKEENKHYNYTPGKYLRFLVLDIMWFIACSQRFKITPSFFHFYDKKMSYQDASLKDPFIVFVGFITGIKRLFDFKYLKSKLG